MGLGWRDFLLGDEPIKNVAKKGHSKLINGYKRSKGRKRKHLHVYSLHIIVVVGI